MSAPSFTDKPNPDQAGSDAWAGIEAEVRGLLASFDRQLGDWLLEYEARDLAVPCRPGCANCCRLAVQSSVGEARLAAKMLTVDNRNALHRHVAELLRRTGDCTDMLEFLRLRRTLGPCPFVDLQGRCAVYPARPFACRGLLSSRSPSWCGADLSGLHPLEKRAFLNSLDPELVAFPSHYLAAPQERGRELEAHATYAVQERFGFSVTGNFPYLVFLETNFGLSHTLAQGQAAARSVLDRGSARSPLLARILPAS